MHPPAAGESVEIPGTGATKRTGRAVNGTATTKSVDAAVAKPAKTTRKKSLTATTPAIVPVELTPAAVGQVQEADLNRYEEEIARLAYHLWEQRGYAHGYHEEDWYRAQEEIKRRYTGETRQAAAAMAGAK